jgi:hypothetical protein
MAIVRGANTQRFGTLITELTNQFAMGTDNYPEDPTALYEKVLVYSKR